MKKEIAQKFVYYQVMVIDSIWEIYIYNIYIYIYIYITSIQRSVIYPRTWTTVRSLEEDWVL